MSLATLKAKWDTFMANRFATIQARQTTYFGNKGRYFQGIVTNAVPTDPAEIAPDLTKKPTDQAESWADTNITLPATLPIALWIDVYNGPQGHGWTLNAKVIVGANTWQICVQGAGAETWRAFDWKQVTE